MNNGSTCVLAERKFALGGHLGIAQHGESHILVILGSIRVIENGRNLLIVGAAQHEIHIVESSGSHQLESFLAHLQNFVSFKISGRDQRLRTRDLVILGGIRTELESRSISKIHNSI